MAVEVQELSTSDSAALKRFVVLERTLVGANALFVSEIDADVLKCLSGRSKYYSEMEYTLFIALNNGQHVARCTALINHRYQRAKREALGFVGHFAAASDSSHAVRRMLEQAEVWLSERGVTRVVGPFNGAGNLGAGILTAAFDEEPVFPFRWNPPYYASYFTDAGYAPTYPLWFYTVDFASDRYRDAERRVANRNSVRVRPINKGRWNQDLETVRVLFNESFEEEWEFAPLTSEEFHESFDEMKPMLDPHQMLIGEVSGQPAGFCLGFPDWTPLFRSFKGKLGIAQIIKFMLGAKRYKRAGLIAIGVRPSIKGTGLAHALAVTLYRRYQQYGLKEAFYYPVNEGNTRSRRFAEALGGTGRVLYHCFDKQLG